MPMGDSPDTGRGGKEKGKGKGAGTGNYLPPDPLTRETMAGVARGGVG